MPLKIALTCHWDVCMCMDYWRKQEFVCIDRYKTAKMFADLNGIKYGKTIVTCSGRLP